MPTVKIPLLAPAYTNSDQTMVSNRSPRHMDGYVDATGAFIKRPGLSAISPATSFSNSVYGIDGLYWWAEKKYLMVVGSGWTGKYSLSAGAYTFTDLSGKQGIAGAPATFASDGSNLLIASGGRMMTTDGSAVTSYLSDVDAPTSVTHVAYLDGYILATAGNQRFMFSDVNSSTSWTATSFANAVGSPDNLVALKVFNREVYLFGETSIEIWEDDGKTPFARIPGGFIETGCGAAYSIVNTEAGIFWLSDKRHIMRFNGNSPERISGDYDKDIANFSTVSDCIAYRIEIDGKPLIIWDFQAAGRTLCYNFVDDHWSDWGNYSASAMAYGPWIGRSYAYCPDWNLHAVGSRTGSSIFSLSQDNYTDNSLTIRPSLLSPHYDAGTSKSKRSTQIRFRCKRGAVTTSTTPYLMIRWRDNGSTRWSNEHQISLGNVGETEMIVPFRPRGIFKTRQYEISCSDAVPLMITDAEEDIEILR